MPKQDPLKSGPLPAGQAAAYKAQFDEVMMKNSIKYMFPDAVCFTLDELKKYIATAEQTLTQNRVPAVNQGLAFIFGMDPKTPEVRKATVVMTATVMTKDPLNNQLITINNPVIGGRTRSTDIKQKELAGLAISENSYNNGSTWP